MSPICPAMSRGPHACVVQPGVSAFGTYIGVQRSAFLIGADGKIEKAWPTISPKDTPTNLLAALDAG